MKPICFALLLTVFAFSCYGQNKVSPKNYAPSTIGAGKPKLINPEGKTPWPYSHSVEKCLQDKAGNLWFATTEGVYRYDGKLFTNYKAMDGLGVLHIASMVADKDGAIWFGAQGGAARYDGKTFTNIAMPAGNALGFLSSLEPGSVENPFRNEKPYVEVFPDRNGNIWFCSGIDLLRYDEKSQAAVQTGLGDYLKNEVAPDDSIRRDAAIQHIYQDKKGNIWFTITGCSTPLRECYRLDGGRANHPCILNKCKHDLHNAQDLAAHNQEIAASLTRITKKYGGKSIDYLSVLDDGRGNMWFGSWDSGVYVYDGKFLTHFSDKDGLGSGAVGIIYEDKSGSLWFGTGDRSVDQGNGAFRYDPPASLSAGSSLLTHFTAKDGLCNNGTFKNNMITSITEDNAGKLWFGGYGGVCRYSGNTFTNFTKKDGLNEQPVNYITKDAAGNLWLGTWELGLYRYNGKSFTCFTENKTGL